MDLRRTLRHAADRVLAPFRRADAGLKAAASITFSGFGGRRGSWTWLGGGSALFGTLPGGERNLVLDAGDVWLNPVVGACIGWIGDNFGEPEAVVQTRLRSGLYRPEDDHDLIQLLDQPNPEYDADAIWFATVLSFVVDGNAYWIKAKSKSGRTLELWWAPWWEIRPHWDAEGRSFIAGYTHTVDGREYPLQKEDVVHFRRGLNPANTRMGLPQLGSVLAEIAGDNAATIYSGAILRNFGMPGVLITPVNKEDQIDKDEAETIMKKWSDRFTGEGRGKPLVNSIPLKVERLSMSPEDLALDKLRTFPEDRICAAMKLSPMVLNLTSGAQAKTYANFETALKAAYLGCLVPLQKTFAKAITRQLLPDVGGISGKQFFEWNYDNVPALAEDMDKRASRAAQLFKEGVIKRGKACELVNIECPPDDDLYVFDVQPGSARNPVTQAVDRDANQSGVQREPAESNGSGIPGKSEVNSIHNRILALSSVAAMNNNSSTDGFPGGGSSAGFVGSDVKDREAEILDLAEDVLRQVRVELDSATSDFGPCDP